MCSVQVYKYSIATFQIWPNFPFGPQTIIHGGKKIESAQKIHASRGQDKMHAHQIWWAWPLWFWRYYYFSNLDKFP